MPNTNLNLNNDTCVTCGLPGCLGDSLGACVDHAHAAISLAPNLDGEALAYHNPVTYHHSTPCPCGAGAYIGDASGYCAAHLPNPKPVPAQVVTLSSIDHTAAWAAAALDIEDYVF